MPVPGRVPWEIQPSLQHSRLITIARVFCDVRRQAMDEHRPALGDTAWGLGCKVYERACFRIAEMAMSDEYGAWVSIVEQRNLRFIFRIGDVPIRFYSGDPERPPVRAMHCAESEREAALSLFSWDTDAVGTGDEFGANRVWRLFIETDHGTVSAITIEQVDIQGSVFNPWSIPLNGPAIVLPYETRRRAVEPAPLDDIPLREQRDKDHRNGAREGAR
jgi:hypothetical protein